MIQANDPGQWPDKTSTPGQRRALRVIAILMILAAICFMWKKWADKTAEPFDDTLQQNQGKIPEIERDSPDVMLLPGQRIPGGGMTVADTTIITRRKNGKVGLRLKKKDPGPFFPKWLIPYKDKRFPFFMEVNLFDSGKLVAYKRGPDSPWVIYDAQRAANVLLLQAMRRDSI
jgi:hypothetical protein